jgi:quinol monooxygenase YgiN
MYEQYADQAALDTHGTSDRIQQLFGSLGPLLDGQPSIEMFAEVGGK